MADSSIQSTRGALSLIEHGDALLLQGNAHEAAFEFGRAVELDPAITGGHLGIAKAYLALGSINYVSLACRKVIELAPESGDGAIAQALLYVLDMRYDAAVKELERAENLAPGNPYVHALRAYCLRRLGNRYDAQAAESKAARLSGVRTWDKLFPQSAPYQEVNGPLSEQKSVSSIPTSSPWNVRSEAERSTRVASASMPGRPIVTYALVFINIAVYLICAALSQNIFSPLGQNNNNVLYALGVQQGVLIFQDPTQAYRILTAMFLHESIAHIGFNMWSLYVVGVLTERIFNSRRFVVIYFVSGIIAGLTQAIAQPSIAALGASGAIFGIFGAFGAFIILRRDAFGAARGSIVGQWIFFLVINLVFSFSDPSIALYDHLGGLVSGFILGVIFVLAANRKKMIS